MNTSSKMVVAAALMAAATPWLASTANALPAASLASLQNAVAPSAETVQYRRGWRGGYRGGYYRGGGVGLGLGLAAGAIIGGAIIATQPYGYGYGPGYAYGPGPGYVYGPGPGYAYGQGEVGYDQGYVGGNDVASCQQRFRSYDPASGSYLGFDGLRHPCP